MIGLQVFASGLKRGPIGNTAAVQVAHLPATHPYVHNACGSARRQPVDVWDVDSLRASGVRVVHVHFGFETRTASDLARWASSLRRTGIGLMHTVHDLDNPHLVDQAPFHRAVEVLVDAADRLLTLTPTAATEVTARFGRRPDVVPHPHVVPLDRMLRRHTGPRRGVYVHAATMRPNLDVELVESLATCARDVGGVRVHVRRGFERSRARRAVAGARRRARRPRRARRRADRRAAVAPPGNGRSGRAAIPLGHPLRAAGGGSRPVHTGTGTADRQLRRTRGANPAGRVRNR